MAFNSQLYLAGRPDLQNNWNKAWAPDADLNDPIIAWYRGYGQNGFDQMLQDDYNNNPTVGEQTQNSAQAKQPATNPPTGQPPVGGFDALVSGNQPNPNPKLPALPNPGTNLPSNTVTDADGNVTTAPAGNYWQNQSGNQGGAFNTVNNTSTVGGSDKLVTNAGTTNQATNNKTTTGATTGTSNLGTTSNTGLQTNNTSGTVNQTTGNTVQDTLGFGQLLKSQAGTVGASDAERTAWLQDTMKTGGSGFNSQVDQAVRQSLSGPGRTGTGESASARAAGYAASDVARNNLGQRLQASQQLAGPTGLASLSSAANPYLGSTSSTTGTSTGTGTVSSSNQGTSSNTGTSNTTGFEDLVGNTTSSSVNSSREKLNNFLNSNENTAGTAVGSSNSSASGQIPQTQNVSSGGGGCVLCTAGIELGQWRNVRVLRKVIQHKVQRDWSRFRLAARGYFFVFSPVARFLLTHPRTSAAIQPVLRAIVYEELRVAGENLPFKAWPWTIHWLGHGLCSVVGRLPVPGRVTDEVIIATAQKYNVLFNVGGDK